MFTSYSIFLFFIRKMQPSVWKGSNSFTMRKLKPIREGDSENMANFFELQSLDAQMLRMRRALRIGRPGLGMASWPGASTVILGPTSRGTPRSRMPSPGGLYNQEDCIPRMRPQDCVPRMTWGFHLRVCHHDLVSSVGWGGRPLRREIDSWPQVAPHIPFSPRP